MLYQYNNNAEDHLNRKYKPFTGRAGPKVIVYSGTKSQFRQDVMTNDIGSIIYNAYQGATGRRMGPRLHDDYCVFRANVAGTRQNKIVLVQHSSITDPDTGGSYTVIPNSACGITREAGGGPSAMRARPDGVYATRRAPAMRAENCISSFLAKKYTSKKKYAEDGAWQHEEIVLKPLNPAYADIVIPNAEAEDFMVVAEVVEMYAKIAT